MIVASSAIFCAASLFLITKILKIKRYNSINPLAHFEDLIIKNPQWCMLLSRELFKNFKKYSIGNDIYEFILSNFTQAQIMSLMADLSPEERRNWRHGIAAIEEETKLNHYLYFLVEAITGKEGTKVRKKIIYKMSSMHKKDLMAFLLSDERVQLSLCSYIKPPYLKVLLTDMQQDKYQQIVSTIINKKNMNLNKSEDMELLNKLDLFVAPQPKQKNIEVQDLLLLMDSEKEQLYYQELYGQKKIDILFESIQKKIPFHLLKLFPAFVLKEFFKYDESWIINYLDSYQVDKRKVLYRSVGLTQTQENQLESKIAFNNSSDEEKLTIVCQATENLFNLSQDLPGWKSTYQMILSNWTETLRPRPPQKVRDTFLR